LLLSVGARFCTPRSNPKYRRKERFGFRNLLVNCWLWEFDNAACDISGEQFDFQVGIHNDEFADRIGYMAGETNATVDVSFSNAVTGTKQLKMLGLDQKYTALTKELLPEIRGLASAYGLNFIPGRWISGIQLTKGGSTVVNEQQKPQ